MVNLQNGRVSADGCKSVHGKVRLFYDEFIHAEKLVPLVAVVTDIYLGLILMKGQRA